jgi:putative spermidine/putrescine transport system substrate-binding protein
MKKRGKRLLGYGLAALLVCALAIAAAGCGGGSSGGKSSSSGGSNLPTKIGKGEGKLTMVAWEGYLQPQWVKPFEQQTGCTIEPKYAGSSDEMVTDMRTGGGGQYDMVSASGDASLRLIYGHDVAPINIHLIKDWSQFWPVFQSPPNNTVKGVHYGVSLQFGPNVLLYNTSKIKQKPTSWSAIYSPQYRGKITVPDNPIQIADAALYLSKAKPSLGITDPYELDKTQFDAAVKLLKQQRPLIKKYWVYASDEVQLFKGGDVELGAAWPQATTQAKAAGVPVADLIPKEGATSWLDTWMLSAKAKHPNCAYKWLNYISQPKVQAEQAVSYPETPVNKLACSYMDKLKAGSCTAFHANEPLSYYKSLKFWKTPIPDCGNGKKDCMDYTAWQQAWTSIKG